MYVYIYIYVYIFVYSTNSHLSIKLTIAGPMARAQAPTAQGPGPMSPSPLNEPGHGPRTQGPGAKGFLCVWDERGQVPNRPSYHLPPRARNSHTHEAYRVRARGPKATYHHLPTTYKANPQNIQHYSCDTPLIHNILTVKRHD